MLQHQLTHLIPIVRAALFSQEAHITAWDLAVRLRAGSPTIIVREHQLLQPPLLQSIPV